MSPWIELPCPQPGSAVLHLQSSWAREGLRAGLGSQLLSGLVRLGGASWVGLVFICGGTEP